MDASASEALALSYVLDSHNKFVNCSPLKDNLGDGYLFKHNIIFRNFRELVDKLGFQFTKDDFCNYTAFSLAALPKILSQSRIPYFDNVSVMNELENKKPGVITDIGWCQSLQGNHILHESAHGVAEHLFTNEVCAGPGLADHRWKLVRALLGEATANTAEVVGSLYAETAIHQCFYSKASYQAPFNTDKWKLLFKLTRQSGT
jgi:hypothetical protein